MASIKLYYFDFRGRAEVSRMVLALAGKEFEDIRWQREDWPKYKPGELVKTSGGQQKIVPAKQTRLKLWVNKNH